MVNFLWFQSTVNIIFTCSRESKLLGSKDFAPTYSTIYKLVTYLDRYKSQISEVAQHIELLKFIQTDEFLR